MSKAQNQLTKGNLPYLKTWDKYSDSVKNKRKTLLLPIKIDMVDGKFVRERMHAKKVKELFSKGRKSISKDWFNNPKLLPDPQKAVDHYISYFRSELSESADFNPPSPLDIKVKRPVFLLYTFERDLWRFSDPVAYRVHNDMDDHTRNFFNVARMDDGRGLMLLNRHYCNPKGLKFDLCVDIKQKKYGRSVTPIIIDPGTNNNQASFP